MTEKEHKLLKLEDYEKPHFQIPEIDLDFIIHSADKTTVRSSMKVVYR